jgi:hypothetical protein
MVLAQKRHVYGKAVLNQHNSMINKLPFLDLRRIWCNLWEHEIRELFQTNTRFYDWIDTDPHLPAPPRLHPGLIPDVPGSAVASPVDLLGPVDIPDALPPISSDSEDEYELWSSSSFESIPPDSSLLSQSA